MTIGDLLGMTPDGELPGWRTMWRHLASTITDHLVGLLGRTIAHGTQRIARAVRQLGATARQACASLASPRGPPASTTCVAVGGGLA